ncbi:MAG: hypothetical protein DRP93_07800, partial [Candidatus Neomarinimicrobiota bacterium]
MLEFIILYIHNDHALNSSDIEIPSNARFISTESGIEALSIASETTIKLIILSEILSHKMDGNELCELLAKNPLTSSIPVIFLTDNFKSQSCENISKFLPSKATPQEIQKQIMKLYGRCKQEHELLHDKNLVLSIINKIHSPIFIITDKTIRFANQCFLDFFKLKSLHEFSAKYPNIQDIFDYENKNLSFLEWIKQLLSSKDEQKIIIHNNEHEKMHIKLRGELL